MINSKILLAVVLPIVLVIGGGGFYYTAFHSAPEKPIVKLPTKYEGNISIFPFLAPYSCDNKTPLKKYWLREYFKDYSERYRVNETVDNITLTINNTDFVRDFVGNSVGWQQNLVFNVTLNSSTYIEKVIFISNATYIYELGNFPDAHLDYSSAYKKYIVKKVDTFYDNYELIAFKFQKSKLTLHFSDFASMFQRITNATMPYYFTVYIETKDKIYEMKFVFNLTNKLEPYLDLWKLYIKYNSLYIPNATYFCYNPTWGKVVISNHLIPGTKYYFVEKDGLLSSIWSPQQVINGGR